MDVVVHDQGLGALASVTTVGPQTQILYLLLAHGAQTYCLPDTTTSMHTILDQQVRCYDYNSKAISSTTQRQLIRYKHIHMAVVRSQRPYPLPFDAGPYSQRANEDTRDAEGDQGRIAILSAVRLFILSSAAW